MPDNPPATRRHWFRFGLRTMFVVLTVFSLWLGWQAKIVRDRREARKWIDENDGIVTMPTAQDIEWDKKLTVPVIRRALGDEPVYDIMMPPSAKDSEFNRMRSLFPEAKGVVEFASLPEAPS